MSKNLDGAQAYYLVARTEAGVVNVDVERQSRRRTKNSLSR
jgi:hypothetical protein